jgi:ABC-type lipoprotein release transport system permease subunit
VTTRQLVFRGLAFYWRSHLAVVAGVGTAVAVLAGALLVGDSVRGSLRDLVLQRLGRVDRVVAASGFFREALAAELTDASETVIPAIVLRGIVSEPSSVRRASDVSIYGVDDRFWRFQGVEGHSGPTGRDAFLSRALADDLGATTDAEILVRIEKPSAIPIDSLHGRKEDPGRTLRLAVRDVIAPAQMGDFSIQPQQGSVRAVFVPLARLQQAIERTDRVNALLVADLPGSTPHTLETELRAHLRLEDYGLTRRSIFLPESPESKARRKMEIDHVHGVFPYADAIEADAGLIDRPRAAAVERAAAATGVTATPVFTYLANSIRVGGRDIPYSLVTAIDLDTVAPHLHLTPGAAPIVLNEWAARDLNAHIGDSVTLDYYVWRESGNLETKSAPFVVADIVPLAGAAADRDLTPSYPGMTDADTLGDWDPPFPIDLKRVRPVDEDYWKRYRTTPKAFVPYEVGKALWASPRYGDRTSVRFLSAGKNEGRVGDFVVALLSSLDLAAGGFAVIPVRQQSLAASSGSTDFGEYFVYFSFFLVVSALVLAALFFRLGVEQRAREVGLLRAVGYRPSRVRAMFTVEGLILALAGSVVGTLGAIAYAALLMTGLRTWWSGAVGTHALTLHVSAISLAAGAAGAIVAAVVCIWWALRGLTRLSERDLLAGRVAGGSSDDRRRSLAVPAAGAVCAATATGLIIAASSGALAAAAAFFGAGSAMLGAGLCAALGMLRRAPTSVDGHGWRAVARIGWRNASARPGRSVLAIAVIASAAFIVISIDAFRAGAVDAADRRSGTGGFPLLVTLDLPLVHDPNGRDGRDALGVADIGDVAFVPFRVRPGEDASCLNLYQPVSPRILGASHTFVEQGRFTFSSSLARDEAERTNPWRLLEARQADGTIPVIADANSITYVLHKSLGDVVPLVHGDRTLQLRLVAALDDSVLQGELVMSDANFTTLFPEQQGYRFLFVDTPASRAGAIATAIDKGAADFGADAISTAARLADYHMVENTYLSTFQTLGGLGLLVGTIGLAAVLLRNVLERRRELALLRAVGYRPSHLFAVVVAENALLLVAGVGLGAVAAAVAIGPAAMARGARLPISEGGVVLVAAVFVAGVVSSMLATRVALRAPLVAALRTE